jgi:hypothetical protein
LSFVGYVSLLTSPEMSPTIMLLWQPPCIVAWYVIEFQTVMCLPVITSRNFSPATGKGMDCEPWNHLSVCGSRASSSLWRGEVMFTCLWCIFAVPTFWFNIRL